MDEVLWKELCDCHCSAMLPTQPNFLGNCCLSNFLNVADTLCNHVTLWWNKVGIGGIGFCFVAILPGIYDERVDACAVAFGKRESTSID